MSKYIDDLVSVIIPVYNAEKFVSYTLDSVINQDYKNIEIIIIDDCSKDNSFDIISKYMALDSRIKYHKMEENSGVALARNKGVELASGRFIAYVDSDDIWLPNKLSTQLELFKVHPNTPLTYTAIEYIDENNELIKGKRKLKESITYGKLQRNTLIATSTVMIDRNVVEEIKMPNRRSGEDYSLWLNILKKYGKAYGINEVFTRYRKSSNSLSSKKSKELKVFYNVQREDLKINPVKVLFNMCFYILNAIKKHYF